MCKGPRSPSLGSRATFHRAEVQGAGPQGGCADPVGSCTNEQRDPDLHEVAEGGALLPAPRPVPFRGSHPEPTRSPRCTFGSGTKAASALSGRVRLSARARGADPVVGHSLPFLGPPPLVSPLTVGSAAAGSPRPPESSPHTLPTRATRAARSNQPGRLVGASHWSPSRSLIGCFLSNKVQLRGGGRGQLCACALPTTACWF